MSFVNNFVKLASALHSRNNSKKSSPTNSTMKKNNRGFSLVQLMVVVGMLGGLSLVVMNITKQSAKSSAKYDFDSDKTQITNEITGILSDPNKCKAANMLLGKNATSDTTITSIGTQYYSLASTTPTPPANGYGNAGIKISSYALSSTAADISANTAYLLVNFQGKNILGVEGTKTSKIKLNVALDGSGNILTCNAVASGSGSQWITSGSNIYYPIGGNVGIGVATPGQKLEINGGLALNTATAKPTCSVTTRGTFWVTQAAAGTKDSVEVCSKDAANAYAWSALGGTGGGLTSCPAGMNMVGDSGKHATYCIDANARAASSYDPGAVNTCYGVNDSTAGRAHVCDFSEWNTACVKGLASAMTGHWEWVSVPSGVSFLDLVTVVGISGCSSSSNNNVVSSSNSFRCCVR